MRLHEYLEKKKITPKQFAKKSGMTVESVMRLLNGETKNIRTKTKERLATFGIYEGGDYYYTFYKGEEVIANGTLEECSEILGKSESNLRYYLTPAYLRRVSKGARIWGARVESKDEPLSRKCDKVKDDETKAVETILYMVNQEKGSAYLSNYNQVKKVREWLKSRGYIYKCQRTDQEDYEIKFAKEGIG